MSAFLSADGKYYPCCFKYTAIGELAEWAEKHGHNIDDIDVKKHGYTKVLESKFYKDFYSSFDAPVCRKECGEKGYTTTYRGLPKWEEYVSK